MKERNLSCVDCGVCVCSSEDGTYPGFCLTANMDEAVKAEIMERYDDEVNRKVMQTAAAVEYEATAGGPGCRKRWSLPNEWAFTRSASPPAWV